MKPLPRAAVWGAVIAGFGVRLWALRMPIGRFNSDDAVVGLMALRINAGEHFLFYWGQDYGGAFEPELTALVFKAITPSSLTLRVAPVGLHALSAWLLTRVGTRLLDPARGELAGLLWWVAPPVGILWSIHAGGYYGALVAIGLGIALVAFRLRDAPNPADAMALGVLLALGVWTSPQIAVLAAVPLLALLVARFRDLWRLAPWALVTGGVVIVPWLRHQLQHDWVSLRPPAAVLPLTYFDRVRIWFRAIPTMLGFQFPYRTDWIAPGAPIAFAVVVAVAGAWLLCARPVPRWLVLWIAVAPLWFAASPFATSAFVFRYLYPSLPIVALVVVVGVRRAATATAILVVAAAVSTATVVATSNYTTRHSRFAYEHAPPEIDPVIRHLDEAGIDRLWADYFVAYRITFATRERIIAAPVDASRYEPYVDTVRAAATRTYVFQRCDAFFARSRFEEHDLAYDEETVDEFAVFTVAEPRRPADIGFHVGTYRQYGCVLDDS